LHLFVLLHYIPTLLQPALKLNLILEIAKAACSAIMYNATSAVDIVIILTSTTAISPAKCPSQAKASLLVPCTVETSGAMDSITLQWEIMQPAAANRQRILRESGGCWLVLPCGCHQKYPFKHSLRRFGDCYSGEVGSMPTNAQFCC